MTYARRLAQSPRAAAPRGSKTAPTPGLHPRARARSGAGSARVAGSRGSGDAEWAASLPQELLSKPFVQVSIVRTVEDREDADRAEGGRFHR
jgi:hypothetical protein